MKKLLKNCLTAEGRVDILIEDDKYKSISDIGEISEEVDEIIDYEGKIIIPAMTDPHVHVRDLEQSDKEDWLSCSNAALKNGITTIFDMPNTIPATNDWDGLISKLKVAKKSSIDYKLFLGVDPDNLVELDSVLNAKLDYIAGIKLFLASSSQNEIIDDKITLQNLFKIAKHYNLVITVHTELQRCLNQVDLGKDEYDATAHNDLRPRKCAVEGLKLILDVAANIGTKIVICHVSTKEELKLITAAKKSGQQVYCEVTPHHLLLDESKTKEFGNLAKVNPPLRTKADNEALLRGIKSGVVDFIGTDHAPHKLEEKLRPYMEAPSGFPGVETALPALIDLMLNDKITLKELVQLTSYNVNKLYKIDKEIKPGNKVNLVVIDPKEKTIINVNNFVSKAKYSPFEGSIFQGKIVDVIYAGKTEKQ
jgi:dihydroorotase